MRHRMPSLVAAALALGFAPAPPPRLEKSEADLKEMQGNWRLDAWIADGRRARLDGAVTSVVIAGDRLKYVSGGKVSREYALTLDASRSPKWYVAKGVVGPIRGWLFRGLYRLEGDTLTLCRRNGLDEARPESFDSAKPGTVVEVYKREKKP